MYQDLPVDLDTFGAPWCGTEDFIQKYPHLNDSVHWVGDQDPVPAIFAASFDSILSAAGKYVNKASENVQKALEKSNANPLLALYL